MSIHKRIASASSAAVLTLSSLMSLGFTGVAHAAANTCTWTGATNNSFNTAGNWSNCNGTVPQNGDNLTFNVTSLTASKTLTNNITNLTVGTITFQGTNSSWYGYELTGSAITLTGNVTDTSVNSNNYILLDITLGADATFTDARMGQYSQNPTHVVLNLNGHNVTVTGAEYGGMLDSITGSGNIAYPKGGNLYGLSDGYSGTITVSSGHSLGLSSPLSSGANVVIPEGATLLLCGFDGGTVNAALTIGGNGSSNNGQSSGAIVTIGSCFVGGGAGGPNPHANATWAGPITLTSNTEVRGDGVFTVTGVLSGSFTLTQADGENGSVVINSSNNTSGSGNGTQVAATVTTTYGDTSPTTAVYISGNNIGIVDGTYGDTTVNNTGTLKGTGTVTNLTAYTGSIVAPGHSPGKLTVLQTLNLSNGATYQAELKTSADGEYDQIVVGAPADTTGNDVTLGDSTGSPTLAVSLYDGFNIKAGDKFTIINNLSQTQVSGTFAGLPEGTNFNVGNGGVFSITYKGGDGNDVVLTAVTAPKAPNTGFETVAAHPAITLGASVAAAGALLLVARKTRKLAPAHSKRSRK